MTVELRCALEYETVPASSSCTVLVMATIHAGLPCAQLSSTSSPQCLSAPQPTVEHTVGSLEECGLGWRVRTTAARRSPWGVFAQRVRLCVEAVGDAVVEKLYTLLEHKEVAPHACFEVMVGDLYTGDSLHIPVRVALPALGAAPVSNTVLRFSLAYIDAATIDTKSCEVGVAIARPMGISEIRPCSFDSSRAAIIMDRERLCVVVSEAMHHAAAQANGGHIVAASKVLADVKSAVATALSTRCGEAASVQALEAVTAAHRRIDRALRAMLKPPSSLTNHERMGPLVAAAVPTVPSPTSPSSSPGGLAGSSIGEPSRAPLQPRNFWVALPPASPTRGDVHSGGPFALGSHNNPTVLTNVTQPSSAADSPPAAHAQSPICGSPHRRKEGVTAFPLTSSADIHEPSPLSPINKPQASLRLLGTTPYGTSRRVGRGPMLRGRPRLQPPVLMPLHAPPMADAPVGLAPPLQLAAVPPLPPPGSLARSRQGSYESWLCRLLRSPLQPLPLPDEIIVHIFTFVEPTVLFHPSLSLPAVIVDKSTSVRGHHSTISSALRAVQPGDQILVRPGVYRESLSIDVPVAIIGCPAPTGGPGVTITSSRNHTMHSTAPFARLENVVLRQTGASGRSCLLCSRGTLEVSNCDISSASGLCVEVTDAATPIVRQSRIHSGAAAGLWFRSGAGGLVEGSEIWGNGWSGVQISDGSNPTLLQNFIHDNKSAGLISFNNGRGAALNNDITSNGKGGVQVRSRACPELSHNRIFNERSFGVWVYEHGFGMFEDNDIVNNAWSGFQVEEGSAPMVIGNRLRGNRSAGIVVYNRGCGTYEWNDISANGRCGVQIKSGSSPVFRRNRIHHEKQAGVLTAEDGAGILEENDIFDNQWSGVQTEGPSNPQLRRNRIHHNGGAGFIAYQNGSGLLEGNNIYSNKKYGVQSKTGGTPIVRHNIIHDKAYGIYLTESGGGVYTENTISNTQGTGIFVSPDSSPTMTNNHGTQ